MILATIEIMLNWPAAALIFSMLVTFGGIIGGLFKFINDHKQDNDRHMTGQDFVSTDVCETSREATAKDQVEMRKYISDVKHDLGDKLEKIIELLLKLKS